MLGPDLDNLRLTRKYQVQQDTVPALGTLTAQGGRQGSSVHSTYRPGWGGVRPDAMGHPSASPRAFPSEAGAADSGQGPEGQKAAFELGPHQPCRWELAPTPRRARLFEAVPQRAFCCSLSSSLRTDSAAWWRQERLLGCQALALTRAHLPRVAD